MFYIQENDKIILFDEDKTRLEDTLKFLPQYAHLEVLETDRPIINGEFADTQEYEEKLTLARKQEFELAFFETSLGWIRRNVTMKDGSTKSFLTDLLPQLVVGIPVLTYTLPDFTQDVNIVDYQQKVLVTDDFIQECKNQLFVDFYGVAPVEEEATNE